MTPRLTLAVLIGVSAGARAQQGWLSPSQSETGAQLSMEPVAGATIQDRVVAVLQKAAAQFGAPSGRLSTRAAKQNGTTFAIVSLQFTGEPGFVHSFVVSDRAPVACHIIVRALPEAIAQLPGTMRQCFAVLGASVSGSPSGMAAQTPAAPRRPVRAASETDLRAALAAVPQSNRPIAIVLRPGMRFNGTFAYPMPTAWMLFPSGLAINCFNLDLGRITITAEVLRAAPYKCGVTRWRRNGASYQFQSERGAWLQEVTTVLTPLRPGQRINVDLENVSGFGSPVGIGAVAVNSLSSGQLRMTSEGEIAVGSWTSVVVSGPSIGGGGTRAHGPAIGRYYADGYTIAIADAQGGVRLGTIAFDGGKGGPYVYLNGEEYWPKER